MDKRRTESCMFQAPCTGTGFAVSLGNCRERGEKLGGLPGFCTTTNWMILWKYNKQVFMATGKNWTRLGAFRAKETRHGFCGNIFSLTRLVFLYAFGKICHEQNIKNSNSNCIVPKS
jgi:hypothetical protein